MDARRSAGAAVAAVVGVLLIIMSGSTAAVAAPAAQRDGVAEIIGRYQARIPELMAQEHIPGLALAVVDGDRVVWQHGFGSTRSSCAHRPRHCWPRTSSRRPR